MMKIHKQGKKLNVVIDPDKLMGIAICLSESPILKNRMLALELKQAMDDLQKRESEK